MTSKTTSVVFLQIPVVKILEHLFEWLERAWKVYFLWINKLSENSYGLTNAAILAVFQ